LAKKNKTTKRSIFSAKKYALVPLIVFLGILCAIFSYHLGKEAIKSEINLISINLMALFAGLILESYRISKNWETLILKIFGSYLLSLFAFFPGKHEYLYNFSNHVEIWPYYIIFFFVIFTVIANREKVTAKLTEGITLLLTMSAIYWAIDYGFVGINSFFEITLLILLLIFSLVTFLHAFTHIKLSKGSRLFLSIWSTIILVTIACDNIIKVFSNENIRTINNLFDGISIGLQYFLLGISLVYIMQNFILLYGFLPSRDTKYKHELQENIKKHVERFSDRQVLIQDSVFCSIYSLVVYTLNYYLNLLPRNTMIWLVVLTFPTILELSKRIKSQMNYPRQA
jgi:hypothetical protein